MVSADVYKSVDESGNAVFSDKPTKGSQKIELQETQIIRLPAAEPMPTMPGQEKLPIEYKSIIITTPQDDAAIRANNGGVDVAVSIDPGLKDGHTLVLYVDGKEVSSGASTSAKLNNLDRGTHSLRASVKDADGRIKTSSKTVTFHLLRHSIQHPSP